MIKTSKKIFYLLVLFLPVNLGKHFEILDSYVWGLVVDYLVPTIYVQDILVVIILLFWVLEKGVPKKETLIRLLNTKYIQVLIFFLFSTLLSVLTAQRFIPSIYAFIRLFLYTGLFLYVVYEVKLENDFYKIVSLVSYAIIFLGVLGTAQFLNQGSVFNNYLFLGEQPYSASTWGAVREEVFGVAKVASYGLFKHPNTFGGFLAIVLIWVYTCIKRNKRFVIPFLIGTLALTLTFSYTAWVCLLIGLFLTSLIKSQWCGLRKTLLISLVGFSILMTFLPIIRELNPELYSHPSFYRRSNLIIGAKRMIEERPLFGVGLNNFTLLIDTHMPVFSDLRFTQPVHNVFLLLFSEIGILGFVFFVLFIFYISRRLIRFRFLDILLVSFIQILFLFSWDHYFLTQHQTHLLFWLVIGLIFS